MTTVTFDTHLAVKRLVDTHLAVKRLVELGYKESHAEEFIKIFQEGKEIDTSSLVTKDYLSNLATKEQITLLEKDVDNITKHFATKSEIHQIEKRILIAIGGSVIATCSIILGFLQAIGKI